MTSSVTKLPIPFNTRGKRILVVDDDRINVRILGGILKNAGYEMMDADSGDRAIACYDQFKPDLVLLDVVMPGMSGFEVCRELRRLHGDACAPIIFITAKSESDDVVEGFSAGGVDYLPKPFRPREALARIGTHLQNRHLLEQLSKANSAKNRFLSMAAHDLRNPLASIRGLSEFLRDGTVGPLTTDQLDLVNTIHDASQSMFGMVNELLDITTIEAGVLKLDIVPNDLATLIEKTIHLVNIEAARKNTRVVFAAHETCIAPFDPAKIKQVVENLLSNAVKYSPPGSTITVTLNRSAAHVNFSVQDQGPGIPDDERALLFQDFGRLSNKPTAGEKSIGLGLAICRKIVEAHEGGITAENLPGRGCEFRVTLPL